MSLPFALLFLSDELTEDALPKGIDAEDSATRIAMVVTSSVTTQKTVAILEVPKQDNHKIMIGYLVETATFECFECNG